LIRAGLVTAKTESAGRQTPIRIVRLKITESGRKALLRANSGPKYLRLSHDQRGGGGVQDGGHATRSSCGPARAVTLASAAPVSDFDGEHLQLVGAFVLRGLQALNC
jgi:hypothetical protein